ncbi:hypothetical protein ACIBG8_41415 [Nonomuraea sp. NPDC050556]|uniref:hypothetical protein n=1 Tax=Nonomuraea sp. NPDC050556 TaxID=3364369 RepID=UPI0037979AC9
MDGRLMPVQWMPIVYGRTHRVDRWWRVAPSMIDQEWSQSRVSAVIRGGRGLVDGPRFLLAHDGRFRLVGVACAASALSETMNSDGQRQLYCFVGWAGPADAPSPSIEALSGNFAGWAAPVYDHWVGLDWDEHPSRLQNVHEAPPGDPPWSTADEQPFDHVRQRPGDGCYAFPEEQRALAWDLGRSSREPVTVITGWRNLRDAEPAPGLLFSAADVSHPMPVEPAASVPRQSRPAHPRPMIPRDNDQTGPRNRPDPWSLVGRLPSEEEPSPPEEPSLGVRIKRMARSLFEPREPQARPEKKEEDDR